MWGSGDVVRCCVRSRRLGASGLSLASADPDQGHLTLAHHSVHTDVLVPGGPMAQSAQQVAVTQHFTPKARSTVLVVDDEPGMRGLARRMLEEVGYDVLEAPDGQAALQLVNRPHAPVSMVLTDIRMPIMNGWQLAEALTSRQPPVPVVLMSGFGSGAGAAFHPTVNFLAKPFSGEALLGLVRRVLAAAA